MSERANRTLVAVCGVGQQHCHWGARYALVRDGPCETVARASVVQNSFAQLFEGNRAGSPNCVPCAQHRRRWERCGYRLRGAGQVAASPRSSTRDAPHHFIQQNFEGRGEGVKPYLATCSALVGRLAADNEPPAGFARDYE